MSKGPGKWQRTILDALETSDSVFLRDLLPSDYSQADYSAIHRAAKKLQDAGKVWMTKPSYAWRKNYTAVSRIPEGMTTREYLSRQISELKHF